MSRTERRLRASLRRARKRIREMDALCRAYSRALGRQRAERFEEARAQGLYDYAQGM